MTSVIGIALGPFVGGAAQTHLNWRWIYWVSVHISSYAVAVLEIDTDLVKPEIRYENLEGGLKLFPHIYGELERDAVLRVRDFTPGLDGFFHDSDISKH